MLRNIIGILNAYTWSQGNAGGAFFSSIDTEACLDYGNDDGINMINFLFKANYVNDYNPIGGHANGESIRPYTVLCVPIYVY